MFFSAARCITFLFNLFLRSGAHPPLHGDASFREQCIVLHITILRSRPAMEGEGRQGNKKGKAKRKLSEGKEEEGQGEKKRDRYIISECIRVYKMNNEMVRDRDSLILPDIK